MNESPAALPSSFRDPAGFVFQQGQEIYRLVTTSGQASYDGLMNSGLYETLTKKISYCPTRKCRPVTRELPHIKS